MSPLLEEMHDAGILTYSDVTAAALKKIGLAAAAKTPTPPELTDEEAAGIEDLKKQLTNGITCNELKDLLFNLGVFGCARSRRIAAVAALLGIPYNELKDCLGQPRKTIDKHKFVAFTIIGTAGLTACDLDPTLCPTDETTICDPSTDPDACGLTADACAGTGDKPIRISNPDDALCPTDTHRGCNDPSTEGTEDLPDTPDCQEALGALNAIDRLFPARPRTSAEEEFGTSPEAISAPGPKEPIFPTPEEEAQQPIIQLPEPISPSLTLYSPATYLQLFYAVINIHDSPAFEGCPQVKDRAEEVTDNIWQTLLELPPGYIPSGTLPPIPPNKTLKDYGPRPKQLL